MFGLEKIIDRAIDKVSVLRPTARDEAQVFIYHQRYGDNHSIAHFFLLQDLDPSHRQRIIDRLADADEIIRDGADTPGIRLHPKHLAVHWSLPEDLFERTCRYVEIEEDVLDILEDIFGWHHRLSVTRFSHNYEEFCQQKLQVEQETGITWHLS